MIDIGFGVERPPSAGPMVKSHGNQPAPAGTSSSVGATFFAGKYGVTSPCGGLLKSTSVSCSGLDPPTLRTRRQRPGARQAGLWVAGSPAQLGRPVDPRARSRDKRTRDSDREAPRTLLRQGILPLRFFAHSLLHLQVRAAAPVEGDGRVANLSIDNSVIRFAVGLSGTAPARCYWRTGGLWLRLRSCSRQEKYPNEHHLSPPTDSPLNPVPTYARSRKHWVD